MSIEQAVKIDDLTAAAQAVGTEPLPPVSPPTGLTVAQAINNAWDAERTFRAAQRRSEEARQAAEQAAKALEQQRAEAAQALKKQQVEISQQEGDLRRKKEELDAREKQALEKELRLLDREQNAALGFLDERRRMVAALEDQIKALHAEREALAAATNTHRFEEESAFRRQLDARAAQWRREESERSARWQQEDEKREQGIAEERRRLTDDLRSKRERAQRAEEQEQAEHRARMAAEKSELSEERAAIAGERKELRQAQLNLAADREMLEEDRRAFDKKVERLAGARVAELEADLRAEREKLARVTAERDRYWSGLESRRELDRRFGDKTPEQVVDRLQRLEGEASELRAKLSASLGEGAARRLAELEKERGEWLDERALLRAQMAGTEARVGQLRIAAVELETHRDRAEALETSRHLLEAALKDLRAEVDRYTQADEKRNPMEALLALDRSKDLRTEIRTRPPLGGTTPTLADFAAALRRGISKGLPDKTLYYTERDVRCFLGGLAMSRLLLLQGISGTGKTSLPLAFAAAIKAGKEVVEVQAGWRDRQDLIGYYNAFHRHYYATNFLQALYRAGTPAFRERPFLIVLDEINLSRVEQFFADFLSALEQPETDRRLTLLNDPVPDPPVLMVEGRHLPIPPNVWFVGTANHDETTTEFADKTFDRAHVMELPRRDPKQQGIDERGPRLPPDPLSYKGLIDAFAAARQKQTEAVIKVLKWLRAEDGIAPLLDRRFRIGWGNRLERDVEQFVPVVVEAGGTAGEALDHLLSTKVLRKLRDRHDVSTKGLDDIRDRLRASWGNLGDEPTRSFLLIERERRAKTDEEVNA